MSAIGGWEPRPSGEAPGSLTDEALHALIDEVSTAELNAQGAQPGSTRAVAAQSAAERLAEHTGHREYACADEVAEYVERHIANLVHASYHLRSADRLAIADILVKHYG